MRYERGRRRENVKIGKLENVKMKNAAVKIWNVLDDVLNE